MILISYLQLRAHGHVYAYDYGHTYEPATSEKTSSTRIFVTLSPLINFQLIRGGALTSSRRCDNEVLPSSLAIRVKLRKLAFARNLRQSITR